MAKQTELSHEQREIVRAQNDALLRLPKDRDERIKLIHGYRRDKALENDKIAQAKKDVGSSETLKRLTGTYGLKPQAIKFINVLAEMAPTDRSAALRQVINHGDDEGWIIPDLFDHGAVGVGSNDEAGETAGFDATSEGKRRGGAQAQPRTTEEMAASHQPAPTPGLPLDEALKQLEAYRAANPPKRGRKAAELVRLEKQVEDAKTSAAEQPDGESPAAEIPDLPESAPGEITQSLREGTTEAEAHIAEQVAAAEPKADKPKGRSRKKADAAETAPPPPPAEAGPSAPPAEDEEDDDFPGARLPGQPGTIGDQPSTFTMR